MGADAFAHFDLLPDLKRCQIIDNITKLTAKGQLASASLTGISVLDPLHPLAHLLNKCPQAFRPSTPNGTRVTAICHTLQTTGEPIAQKARRLTPEKLKAVRLQFKVWCDEGTCRPSNSPWASPIHIVPKKTPGEFRVCGDYRKFNAVTAPNKYPVPNLKDFTNILSGKSVFSTLDLHQAFNQIPMAPEDVPKTALITPIGLFEFLYMPYGLRNASQTFQRFINEALGDLPFTFVYIDDVLVASASAEEHEKNLELVLARLHKFNLRLNVDKCTFAKSEVTFLSHTVSAKGFVPLKEKVQAIVDFPQPRNIDELRRFLGLLNFYRPFIRHAASLSAPLTTLVTGQKKKDLTPILWSQEATQTFLDCKSALVNATQLSFPQENAQLRLVTDASTIAAGASLEQLTDRGWQPLGFFSKKFSSGQRKYAPYDLELTAIYMAIKYFHSQLEGQDFDVWCDHKPLQYAFVQAPEHAPIVRQRQLAYISQYTTSIKYLPGLENSVADALSRMQTNEDQAQSTSQNSSVDAFALPTSISLKKLAEEQAQDEQLHMIISDPSFPLALQKGTYPVDNQALTIYYNLANDSIRSYVPVSLRREVFDIYHRLAIPGPSATNKLIRRKFVWPKMSKDIAQWVKHCLACQQAKISRHTKLAPAKFTLPDDRFSHVHLDIVTLVPSEGFSHVLTMIDRYARWPEAVPIADMQATTVARAFIDTWVARYGAPEVITTDQGLQFESELFVHLCKLLGTNKTRTTPYHPQCNGILERWHRDFKSALMCFESDESWTKILPLVMLGLRTRVCSDINASPAEIVFGSTLRLPGEFFSDQD
ncbi:hypothetical protein TKK_0017681 [Trichogramma kaykai]